MPLPRRRRRSPGLVHYTLREAAFHLLCRHRQGDQPNILLFCTRRGGSTWLLNTLAAHPGTRYVGRPFMTALWTRHRRRVPDLERAAGTKPPRPFRHIVRFEGEDERRFREFAGQVVRGELEVHPSLNFRGEYFHRVTNRIVFQMTSGGPLIEWFDECFPVQTLILLRHPISNALSVVDAGWDPECHEFLFNPWFLDTHLTGAQTDFARRIEREGSLLERHVLDWCFKVLVPLRAYESGRHPDWTLVTYEQMVTEPERIIRHIAARHGFRELEPMLAQIQRPSRTVARDTASHVGDRGFLVQRWRSKVDAYQESDLMRIPETFGIEAYARGANHAAPHLLVT